MIALPYPNRPTAPHGQTDAGGHPDGAGQPDRRATAAGAPICRLDERPGAPLYLVTRYISQLIVCRVWVYGWPGQFTEASAIHKRIDMQQRAEIDERLAPVGWACEFD